MSRKTVMPARQVQRLVRGSPAGRTQSFADAAKRIFLNLDGMPWLKVCGTPMYSDLSGCDVLCNRGHRRCVLAKLVNCRERNTEDRIVGLLWGTCDASGELLKAIAAIARDCARLDADSDVTPLSEREPLQELPKRLCGERPQHLVAWHQFTRPSAANSCLGRPIINGQLCTYCNLTRTELNRKYWRNHFHANCLRQKCRQERSRVSLQYIAS